MDAPAQLAALLELAEQSGLGIRLASMSSESLEPGGTVVRLKGREILFLDPAAAVREQIAAAATALRGRPELQDKFIPPELRQLIDGAE